MTYFTFRDIKNVHKVISRTEAKKQFALKDEDLDMRRPILRYQSKKNPHNPRYGDMKLYLLSQVEKRACEVHGSLQQVEVTKEERKEKRAEMANKRFENRIKNIRKQVRYFLLAKKLYCKKRKKTYFKNFENYFFLFFLQNYTFLK